MMYQNIFIILIYSAIEISFKIIFINNKYNSFKNLFLGKRTNRMTNNYVNKNKDGYINASSILELKELINEEENFVKIWNEIKDLSIKLILSNYENEYKEMKLFNLNKRIIFRYYDLDIIIDKNYKPWLLEVNKYSYMNFYDEVNKNNKLEFNNLYLIY